MEKLNFSTTIHAPKEKVWSVLWDKDSYPKWTSVFAEGSDAISDWEEGSKILFVSGGEGMVSRIETKRPNEFMRFEHLGMIKDNVEDTESEEVKKWAGAMEAYTLREENGKTLLAVDMDITPDFKDYFLTTWPKALEKVKELAE
jgi:ligand-binding SRPBCC domain-containing protein